MSLIRQTSSLAPVRYKSEPWNYLPTIPLERAYSTVGARLMESSIDMAVRYILSSWTSWFRLSMGFFLKNVFACEFCSNGHYHSLNLRWILDETIINKGNVTRFQLFKNVWCWEWFSRSHAIFLFDFFLHLWFH